MTSPPVHPLTRAAPRCSRAAALAVAAAFAATGCATTVTEPTDAVSPAATTVSTTVAPTVPPSDDPLAALTAELTGLGSLVAAGGPADDEALVRIEGHWVGVQQRLDANDPDLLDEFDVVMNMTRTSVERRRPADADKAFGLLLDLLDRVTPLD